MAASPDREFLDGVLGVVSSIQTALAHLEEAVRQEVNYVSPKRPADVVSLRLVDHDGPTAS